MCNGFDVEKTVRVCPSCQKEVLYTEAVFTYHEYLDKSYANAYAHCPKCNAEISSSVNNFTQEAVTHASQKIRKMFSLHGCWMTRSWDGHD